MGSMENDSSIKHLWLIKQVKPQKYEIVNFVYDLVMDVEEEEVRLERGKLKSSQLFTI